MSFNESQAKGKGPVEDQVRGRRAAATRRGPGLVAKQFQKINILLVSDDYPFCSGFARIGEVQQLGVSIFWSSDGLSFVSKSEFDAAIVEAPIWPAVRSILEGWTRLQLVIIRGEAAALSLASSNTMELLQADKNVSPDKVVALLAEAVQRHQLRQISASDSVVGQSEAEV